MAVDPRDYWNSLVRDLPPGSVPSVKKYLTDLPDTSTALYAVVVPEAGLATVHRLSDVYELGPLLRSSTKVPCQVLLFFGSRLVLTSDPVCVVLQDGEIVRLADFVQSPKLNLDGLFSSPPDAAAWLDQFDPSDDDDDVPTTLDFSDEDYD